MANKELASGSKEGDVLTAWQAALSISGLGPDNPNAHNYLAEKADFTRTFAWELVRGKKLPSQEQARRIIEACQPLIEARKARGEIIDL